jgi:predicted MFS family arabinose efflux permease
MNTTPTGARALHVPEGKRRPLFLRRLRRFFLHRHFALLWSGQTVSTFCSYITGMGLPIAAWLLLHATPAQMGLLTALAALPGLLLGLLIGVWVDRLPRRLLMITADLGRALLLASIPLAAMFGLLRFALFYVVTVLVGLFTAGFEVASLSFLPTLLLPEELITGNSRLSTSDSLAEIAGPPLAGVLIRFLTVPVAILLDVLSFLFSALCVSLIRVAEAPRGASTQRPQLWREIREGLGVLLGNPLLRTLAAFICTQNFFGGAFAVLYLIYTLQRFEANTLVCGLLVACGGVSALVGSFCANWCTRRFGSSRTLIGSTLLHGLLSFCTPLAAGPMLVVFVLMALSQLIGDTGFAVYSINEVSLRQQLVPDHLLGRVNAGMQMLSTGIMPLGALLAGLLSELIGIRLTLLIGSAGMFLAPAWLFFSPLRRSI